MTTTTGKAALRPAVASFGHPASMPDAVLRMLSGKHAVVGGVIGQRPGDRVRLVLHGGDASIRDCRVMRATLQGIELEQAPRS